MAGADFAVAWDDPGDARFNWNHDKLHNPYAVPPLVGELQRFVDGGLAHGFETYKIPARLSSLYVNGYIFMALKPEELDPGQAQARGEQSQAAFMDAIARLRELWEGSWEPELRTTVEELESVDLTTLDDAALADRWEHVIDRVQHLWHVHFECLLPSYLAISELDELYRNAVPGIDANDSFKLIQGIDNLTVASGRGLWDLAQRAKAAPEVLTALRSDDPRAALETADGGPAFSKHLQAYLEEFGHRGDLWSIEHPSWIEDPSPVYRAIVDYADRDGEDPRSRMQRLGDERAALIADARAKVAGTELEGPFNLLAEASEIGVQISEDHNYWVDFRGMQSVRRAALEAGRRLVAANRLDDHSDVMYLRSDEIAESLRDGVDRRALASERKTQMDGFRTLTPPPFIGAPPEAGPDNPVARAVGKFFGGPAPESDDHVIKGVPVSPGKVTATARLISSIADSDRLEPGEVLVCATTSPPWTPLFGIAGAVVTDSGGPISHTAVVAREYGLPAVVGTDVATVKIPDGATVEVDGDAGTIRILG